MTEDNISELLLRLDSRPDGRYAMEAVIDGMGLWTGGNLQLTAQDLEGPGPALEYGRNLWMKLVRPKPDGWPELQDIFAKACGPKQGCVRLRLMLGMDEAANDLHKIRWELLVPAGASSPVGVDIDRPVSRFLALQDLDVLTPDAGLNMLLAIASPSNLSDSLKPIEVNAEITSLLDALERDISNQQVRLTVLPGQTPLTDVVKERLSKCELVPGYTTADAIRKHLAGKHVFHLIAHGDFKGLPIVVLEDEAGKTTNPPADDLITKWTANKPRLVFLQSCNSDPQDKALPSAGLATGFVQKGVPAVVAMRDFVDMTAARIFASAFYRKLLETGEVDFAANAGRNATFRAKSNEWAIPVLYSRLRSGQKLWAPEPIRQSIQRLADRWADTEQIKSPFPVEVSVVRNIDVVQREIDQPTMDARLDAFETAVKEMESDLPQTKIIVLVGGRGRGKSSLLKKLFFELARKSATENCPRSLLLLLKDCMGGTTAGATVSTAWAATLASENIDFNPGPLRTLVEAGRVNLLVDGDDDLGEPAMGKAIGLIRDFVRKRNACALISIDESAFQPHFFEGSETTVLIVQDLRATTLTTYLDTYHQQDISSSVRETLIGPLRDLAGVPWLLSKLLSTPDPQQLRSRFRVLARIVQDMVAHVAGFPGGSTLARIALMEKAWLLHSKPASSLSMKETYTLLGTVRGTRDFPLDTFRSNLIECGLVARSGPDGIRFAYSASHSYFTACYLNNLPPDERTERVREIVAGLGRPERLRRWEEVLVLLAGHLDKPSELLEMLLELGFGEGEHLLLAARCMHEARTSVVTPGAAPGKWPAPGSPVKKTPAAARSGPDEALVVQLADSLIWWSLPQSGLMARSRQRAVQALGYLLPEDSEETAPLTGHDETSRIVRHLFRLALEPVRIEYAARRSGEKSASTNAQLDYSIVRLQAVTVLLRHQKAALEYLHLPKSHIALKDEVLTLIQLWSGQNYAGLRVMLNNNDNTVMSGVAAFVLASLGTAETLEMLKERFFAAPVLNEVHWSILDGLTEMKAAAAAALVSEAIVRFYAKDEVALKLADYIVYGMGKLGGSMSDPNQQKFLDDALKSENIMLQARAVRASAEILGVTMDADKMNGLRHTCHLILDGKDIEAQQRLGVASPRRLNPWARRQLATYTVEALSHIGDASSISVLRSFYLRPAQNRPDPRDEMLRKTSWETAEAIRLRTRDEQQKRTQNSGGERSY